MRLATIALLTIILSFATLSRPAGAEETIDRVINLTSDSAPGWLPSKEQEAAVLKTTSDYFALLDNAKHEQAYAMMTGQMKKFLQKEMFVTQKKDFHTQAGLLEKREVLKVTWTKDSARAPVPGMYAAVDIASRFANVDRHCGYIVLYQGPDGKHFEVMREESNFIPNAMAQGIVSKHSQAKLDQLWKSLSANCPNYPDTK